jgi:REase_DpnII-MboI
MLRASFPDLVDEDFFPRFGAKNFKPDFGIPSLRLLIEAKHLKGSKTVGQIQDELQADVVGYKESKSDYESVIFFIYDTKGEVAANTEMQRVIRELPGVGDVIVVAGPAASEE